MEDFILLEEKEDEEGNLIMTYKISPEVNLRLKTIYGKDDYEEDFNSDFNRYIEQISIFGQDDPNELDSILDEITCSREYKCEYKLKDNIDTKILKQFGYAYTGNYNRGDQWTKKIDDEVLREIIIHGDWDNRRIFFGFPYMHIDYPSIKEYIQDLIKADLVEEL